MQYLTPQELRKIAPATQKMPQSDDNLVSTKAFLRHVEKLGFEPIFAAQGTAHLDADEPLKSRHMVVAANKAGAAVMLLNSHSIWRRAWLGYGFVHDNGSFIMGAALPLQRWKGFEDTLVTALSYQGLLLEAQEALCRWKLEKHQSRWLAKTFAASAWLKGHKKPQPKALYDFIENGSAYDALNIMLGMARAGGLAPVPSATSSMPPRRLKPIIAPDALFHAANRTFEVGTAGLRKYKLGDFSFPSFKNTK